MGMKGKIALGVVVGVVVIGAMSANAGKEAAKGSGDKGSSAAQHSASTSKGKADEKPALSGDGSYLVGKDVKPGTYRTTGNSDGCYWERAKDASGDTDSLIANDNVAGASYVTIKATDKIFKSSDCNDWQSVGGKATGKPAGSRISGDGGMYRVGDDIAPGTYKSTGNTDDQCYWERAKDALHSVESIKANDNVTGTAIVTISAGDAYFKTTGCKDWTKTS